MTLTSFLFSLLLLALLAAAKQVVVNRSPVTLPLARFINFTGVHNLLQHDQARAQVLKNRAFGRGSAPAAIINEPITLGVGPVDLTAGTLTTKPESTTIPTVTDHLFKNGAITSNEIGIFFAPITQAPGQGGEITWGGADTAKFDGSINYTPITGTSPASAYWGIDESITYGGTTILETTAGIVDTGTTLILIATDAYKKYQVATGATFDSATGLLTITLAQYNNLKNLVFTTPDGVNYTLIPNAQIWPRSLNANIGGTPGSIYLIIGDLGSNSGQGLDFINGFAFLQRFYSVYDTGSRRVGLATTPFTYISHYVTYQT